LQHLGYILAAVGALFLLSGGLLSWLGMELIRNPWQPTSLIQFELEPEALRLLRFLYEVQTRNDLSKLIIGRDGAMRADTNGIPKDINVVADFFSIANVDERSASAFEKLLMKIPLTYLRSIPETRLGSPFVVSVTPEGVAYLRSRDK